MASDAEQALAFAARREGTASMPAKRWAHVLSLELGWMAPAQARRFVESAKAGGWLEADGDDLRLTFDEDDVQVARGFKPRPDAPVSPRPTASDDPFADLLQKVSGATGRSKPDLLSAVQAWQDRMGGLLEAEAALLTVAQEAGIDVAADAAAALDRLKSVTTKAPE